MTRKVGKRKHASSYYRKVLHKLVRSAPTMIGLVLLMCLTLVALLAPWIAPYSPTRMNVMNMLERPSSTHLLGTDDFGRDVLSRLIYGARISLRVGAAVSVLSGLMGTALGVLSAYYRVLDNFLMRAMDLLLAFPAILLALAFMAILGPAELNAILALSLVYLPRTARVCRSQTLAIREEDYVQAAKAIGVSDLRIQYRHILPNVFPALLVQQTLVFALAILVEAALSFLGVGTPPPAPSWGNILNDARDVLRVAPWISIAAGGAISVVVLAINLVGDGLRDVLDPKAW